MVDDKKPHDGERPGEGQAPEGPIAPAHQIIGQGIGNIQQVVQGDVHYHFQQKNPQGNANPANPPIVTPPPTGQNPAIDVSSTEPTPADAMKPAKSPAKTQKKPRASGKKPAQSRAPRTRKSNKIMNPTLRGVLNSIPSDVGAQLAERDEAFTVIAEGAPPVEPPQGARDGESGAEGEPFRSPGQNVDQPQPQPIQGPTPRSTADAIVRNILDGTVKQHPERTFEGIPTEGPPNTPLPPNTPDEPDAPPRTRDGAEIGSINPVQPLVAPPRFWSLARLRGWRSRAGIAEVDELVRTVGGGALGASAAYLLAGRAFIQNGLLANGWYPLITSVGVLPGLITVGLHGGRWLRAIRNRRTVNNFYDNAVTFMRINNEVDEQTRGNVNQLFVANARETDARLIDTDNEQDLLRVFDQITEGTPAEIPFLDNDAAYARYAFALFVNWCRRAYFHVSLPDTHPAIPGINPDAHQILAMNCIQNPAVQDPTRVRTQLVQLSIAYGKLIARQHHDKRRAQVRAGTMAASVASGLLIGNPIAGGVVAAGIGTAYWFYRQAKVQDQHLEIGPNGRITGRDNTPILSAATYKPNGPTLYQPRMLNQFNREDQLNQDDRRWVPLISIPTNVLRLNYRSEQDLAIACAPHIQTQLATFNRAAQDVPNGPDQMGVVGVARNEEIQRAFSVVMHREYEAIKNRRGWWRTLREGGASVLGSEPMRTVGRETRNAAVYGLALGVPSGLGLSILGLSASSAMWGGTIAALWGAGSYVRRIFSPGGIATTALNAAASAVRPSPSPAPTPAPHH